VCTDAGARTPCAIGTADENGLETRGKDQAVSQRAFGVHPGIRCAERCMVECSASAISSVASPNFTVSHPLATMICFSGTPSRCATADDGHSGPPGDRTDFRNMIKVRVGNEDRFGPRYDRRHKAKRVAPRRGVEIGIKQIDLIFVSKFEIGIGEPPNDDNVRV
jgi:hypothetical protein